MWHIGQTIVAIKSHSQGKFKEGDVFEIKGLKKSFCKCIHILIDIGMSTIATNDECGDCNIIVKSNDNIHWFGEDMFKPLDELADISELTELLENTQPFEINKQP